MSEETKAGWYPDPVGEATERWWDGSRWTSSVRSGSTPSTRMPQDATQPQSSKLPWRAVLVVALALIIGGGAVALLPRLDDRSEDEQVAVEEPKEPQLEEPEELQPVDLRNVDWTAVTWTTSCTEFGNLEDVRLSLADDDKFGSLIYDVFPDSETPRQVYSVDHPEAFGDVTGDGLDDAVFITSCFYGNDFEFSVEVWSHDQAGEPTHLPPVFSFTKFDGAIQQVDIVDGSLRVWTHEPLPGDEAPHLNGYPVEVITDWQFVAQRWIADEVSRSYPGEYGSNPYFDDLYDACADGDIDSCRQLYFESPFDSGYESYGQNCGERMEPFCWDGATEQGDIVAAFRTPTGNIYCAVMTYALDELECGIGSGLNPNPSRGQCEFDWSGLFIPQSGAAGPTCISDYFLGNTRPDELPVLNYGESWVYGEITCWSERTGLECANRSGGGFTLARRGWNTR